MKGISVALAIPVIVLVLLGAGAVVSGTFGPINQLTGSINQTGYDARQNALSEGALSDTEDESAPEQDNDQNQESGDAVSQPGFDNAPELAATGQDVTFSASATASEEVLTRARFFMNSEPAGLSEERPNVCGESTQSAVSTCSSSETLSLEDITEGTKGYELRTETQFETDSGESVELETENAITDTEIVEIDFEVPESVEGDTETDVGVTAAAAPDAPILESVEVKLDGNQVLSTSCTGQSVGNEVGGGSGSKSCSVDGSVTFPSGDDQAELKAIFRTTELGAVENTATVEVNPGSGLAVTVLNNEETPVQEAEVSILEQTETTGPDGVAQFNEIGGEITEIKVDCDGTKRTFDNSINPEQTLEEQVQLLSDETSC